MVGKGKSQKMNFIVRQHIYAWIKCVVGWMVSVKCGAFFNEGIVGIVGYKFNMWYTSFDLLL